MPGARLVALDSNNHILLAGEPAWTTFVDEVTAFLEPDRQAWADRGRDGSIASLSARERDVLRALRRRAPRTRQIAAKLGLSPRTVERHLSNVYLKLGLSGTAARAGAVARYLRGVLTLRVGRHRGPRRRPALRAAAVPMRRLAGRRSPRARRPQTRRGDPWRTEAMLATTIHETESLFRAEPDKARSKPTVTATLANGHARLSAGAFNWDADLPAVLGGEQPVAEPDRLPARRAGRLRRRVPARHARSAVRRRDRRRDGGRRRGLRPARPGRDRGRDAGPDGSRARHPRLDASPADRVAAMFAAWRERCPIYLALLKPNEIALTTSDRLRRLSRRRGATGTRAGRAW